MSHLFCSLNSTLLQLVKKGSQFIDTINKCLNGDDDDDNKVAPVAIHTSPRLFFQFEYLTLIVVVLIVVRQSQRKWLKGGTRKSWIDSLPGPRTFPIVGGLLYISADLTKTFKILLKWGTEYGSIYRVEGLFNEPGVVLNDATHVQTILSSNQLGLVSKPDRPYDAIFGQFLKNGLLVSEGEYWRSHRRTVSRAFTYKSFNGYNKIFNRCSTRLVEDLEKRCFGGNAELECSGSEAKEISDLIHCCSLQIVCESVMGLDLRDNEAGRTFYENLQRYKIISGQRATYFLYHFEFIWRLLPISREYTKIIDILNGITKEIIERRSNTTHLSKDEHSGTTAGSGSNNEEEDCEIGVRPCRNMIDEMLAADLTAEEILVEANTVIAAGFESTSLTIHYLLLLLALNPDHQLACQEEIDELFNDPVMFQDDNLTLHALSNMKYLERCCFETLRLFPVIFMFQRRSEAPVKLDEHHEIPAGVTMIIPTYTLHRNPNYFPNPDQFNPDHFLAENVQKRHPYAFVPFSAGIRNCIGYKFAIMEIKAVAAKILRRFHVATVDEIDNVPILPSIVMTPVRDYKFILKRRSL